LHPGSAPQRTLKALKQVERARPALAHSDDF
jgi:hypothetical protein